MCSSTRPQQWLNQSSGSLASVNELNTSQLCSNRANIVAKNTAIRPNGAQMGRRTRTAQQLKGPC
jgi:hypothetical protein